MLAIAIYFCSLKRHTVVSSLNESVPFKLSPLGPKGNPLLAPAPWVAVCKKNITEGPPQTLGVLSVLLVAVQIKRANLDC